MPDFTRTDSIIFDMDGTLWNGIEAYAGGFNDYFSSSGINRRFAPEDITGYMGWEQDLLLADLFPQLTYNERITAYQQIVQYQYRRIEKGGGYLYEGVKEGLEQLSKKFPLFIVSNCPEFTIDYFMKWAGIEHLITDSMAHGKNFKHKHENIRLLMQRHKLESPVYVGDTDGDGKQSRLVPLPFVFVDFGFGKTDAYDLTFSSFGQLVRYFLQD